MTVVLGRDDPYGDAALASVRPGDASAYLTSRGWQQVRQVRRMGLWVAPEEGLEVLAPLEGDDAGFRRAIYKLVRDLSVIEDRPAGGVLRDLLSVRLDTIRVRVRPRGDQDDASIPLQDGVILVEQTRNLLVAAARSAVKPQPSHPPGAPPGQVRTYLDSARLGQTEQGSYVVAIISPVGPAPEEAAPGTLFPAVEQLFPRRVTQTLVRGADAARETADEALEDEDGLDRFLDVVERGVSANLCDSLAKIGRVQQGGFTVGFAWAPLRPAPDLVTAVEFGDRLVPVLERAAELLRHVDIGELTLEGQIQDLKRDWEHGPGWIRVIQPWRDPRQVWVHLGSDAYERAILAHYHSERIRVRGRLVREGRRWELAEPQSFTVLEG